MGYEIVLKSDWNARPICGSDEFLKTCERIEGIDGAEWIWPLFSTRGFLRRDFWVCDDIISAKAEFICDNSFDMYFGEQLITQDVKRFSGDVTKYIKKGKNSIALRVFQTNDILRFTSAICGEIVIKTAKETYKIVTDGAFHNFHPEFSNNEPAGWLTAESLKEAYMKCSRLHPRLLRRSLYMRKSFEVSKEVESAELCVHSAGEAEMYLNGEKIGDEYFSQGINDKYSEYHIFEIGKRIKSEKNVIGAITGNTWLNSESHNVIYSHKNELLAELHIKYSDGTEEYIGTDNSWKIAASPIIDNDLQFGERYDARLEIKGWSSPEYSDAEWSAAEQLPLNCGKPYIKRNYEPIRITELLSAKSKNSYEGGILYDFGINCAGKYILKLKNTEPGQTIKISVCEMLKENGAMQSAPYAPVCNSDDFYKTEGRAKAAIRNYDVYICRGGKEEYYMPRFAFNGFRYIKIEGADAVQIEDIKLAVMHNDIDFGSKIESGDPFFRDFSKITERTMRGNMLNGFMDCPTREKNFWTGDIGVFAPTACFLGDVEQLLARWTDGGRKLGENSYGWGDEIYTIPLLLYQFYGDKSILKDRYADILRFTYQRVQKVDGGLPNGDDSPYNDHLNPYKKNLPGDFFASCYYCYNLSSVALIAKILGDRRNEERLCSYYNGAVTRFNDKYFIWDENNYTPHIQSGLVLPLAFGIVPKEREKEVAENLARYIREQGSLTTGYVATSFLMQVLCDYGFLREAYMLLSREEFPSWRNLIKGATTITEHWNGMEPSGCSKNHFALGSLTGWMFEYLGGIRYKASAPGFTSIVLQPIFIKEIGDFSCEYTSKNGKIKTETKIVGDKAIYSFSADVPVKLVLPDGKAVEYPTGYGDIEIVL